MPLRDKVQHHINDIQDYAEKPGHNKIRLILRLGEGNLYREYDNHDSDLHDVDKAPRAEHQRAEIQADGGF